MWWRRAANLMPWRRTPLRRRSDRVQAWCTLASVLGTLLIAPIVAFWTAGVVFDAEDRASAWERQHHRAVPAVLTADAPVGYREAADASTVPLTVAAPAQWTGPDGIAREAPISVPAGSRAGSTVTVWIDDRGVVVAPPRESNAPMDALVAAMLSMVVVTGVAIGLRRIVVWRLDRRRLRSWEAEWLIVGPGWSRR